MIGGRVAKAICGDVLARLADDRRCVMVTGTNGKSTTTRMVVAALEAAGHKVAVNQGGDNMEGGVVSALMSNMDAPFVILEVDEMHMPSIAAQIRPEVLLYLNLSRDQLDRVGGVSVVEGRLREAAANSPQAVMVVNCDDPQVTSAAWDCQGPHVWVAAGLSWTADSVQSPRSKGSIVREGLDWYDDSLAEFRRPDPDFELGGDDGANSGFRLIHNTISEDAVKDSQSWDLSVKLPGRANRANALMAVAAAYEMGVDIPTAIRGVQGVVDIAGRYKVARIDGRDARLILAKNPAGFQEALSMRDPSAVGTVLAVNARVGDGTDISWIQDVDFSSLSGPIVACGEEGLALQKRLKEQGVEAEFAPTAREGVLMCEAGAVDVLANYTAFQDLYVELKAQGLFTNAPRPLH